MNFSVEDDFKAIIELTLKTKVIEINKISTGWTNYVFIVKLKNNKKYVFRFPRNNFFARTLKKEEFVCKALKHKLPFKLPNIKLYYFENKPFTKHNYLNGKTLTEVMETLSKKEINLLAKDLAKFLKALQSIKIKKHQIKYRGKTLNLNFLSQFLEGLSSTSVSNYDLEKHKFLKSLENKNLTLSHGDFNPGNILLNKHNRMFVVLDFAFFTLSSPHIDLSRMIGRLPQNYKNALKNEYEKKLKTTLPNPTIKKLVITWNYVEEKYIEYIKQKHKDIILPSNLL